MKKNRVDSFLGFHFDFHANSKTKGIGTKTNAADIGKLLDEIKPDYIQIDTKGHPGYASYFSEYATVAPGLEVDHIKIFREETEKRGIALYAHHSGLWERVSCEEHPNWGIVNKDGTICKDANDYMVTMDPTGEYPDKKLIPCLKELAGKYGFDGAWIDGDWAMRVNWKEDAVEDFLKKSGYEKIDDDPMSDSYIAFMDYWREKFEEYLKHFLSEVHKDYPNFEMTSNYAFAQHMPRKPIDEVDYLSGDTVGTDVRITARCFAGLGKPWDTMSWAQADVYTSPDPSFFPMTNKHIERLCREAAMSISQGGGYEICHSMTQQGQIRMYDLERMKEISRFMYERKPFNFKSQPVKNAAFLLSEYDTTRKRIKNETPDLLYTKIYGGMCDIVLDGGMPCDIIYEYQISEPGRKTIILPEIEYMSDEIKEKLKKFTENGGNLIVCGRKMCKMFADMADADLKDYDGDMVYVEQDGSMFGMHDAVVFEKKGAKDLADCYRDAMTTDAPKISAVITNPYGKGKVVFIGLDVMRDYYFSHAYEESEFMCKILRLVDNDIAAYLESGNKRVEVIPAIKDGKILINLINIVEFVSDVGGVARNEIPALYDLTIAVKCDKCPKKVMLEPEHIAAEYTYDGKYVHVKVDKLHIHRIITVE